MQPARCENDGIVEAVSVPLSPSAVSHVATLSRARATAVVALFGIALLWGYTWVATKIALRSMGVFEFVALRTSLGALALFVLAFGLQHAWRMRDFRTTLTLGLLQTTGFVGLSAAAVSLGGAGKSAILAYTMPFWTLMLAWFFLRERLRTAQWTAVAIAFIGLILLFGPQAQGVFGKLLAVSSGVLWAAAAIVAKRRGLEGRKDLLALTAWQMLLGSLPLIALALAVPSAPIVWSPMLIAVMAYTAVGTALGWVLWLYVLRTLPAGLASLGTLATPVIAILGSWWHLGERPTPVEARGMLLIAFGLVLLSALAVIHHRRQQLAMAQD